jgi:hypothetical protein
MPFSSPLKFTPRDSYVGGPRNSVVGGGAPTPTQVARNPSVELYGGITEADDAKPASASPAPELRPVSPALIPAAKPMPLMAGAHTSLLFGLTFRLDLSA